MLFRFIDTPEILLYIIPVILMSLTFHEFSHGYISYRLGDPTAANEGRLSLNPIRHLDPIGTLMFLFSRFGWAKPVPINPMYYKDKKKGTMLVSLAGPLSNILLAFIFSIPMYYIGMTKGLIVGNIYRGFDIGVIMYNFSYLFYMVNIGLAAFNLIPIPPLDGSKILQGLLPTKQYMKYLQYERMLSIALLFVIFIFRDVLSIILNPIIKFFEFAINTITIALISFIINL